MRQIMRGELTPAQIGGFIIGLRVKKETIGEIAAAAQVMREFATTVQVKDASQPGRTCGTGGDGAHTFNVSTGAAFVAAAAGARVAKHRGRSVSSSSGSAEVLEALGAQHRADARADRARRSRSVGVGFMFAPEPPRGDEVRRAGAQGARRAHDLQHPRAAHQPGGRAEPGDGRVPPRPGGHPDARAAAPGREARDGGLRPATAWTRSRSRARPWWASW